MIEKKAANQSKAAQRQTIKYSWVATAALIAALILGFSVAPPEAVAQGSTGQGESEASQFSSQAEAIDYYLADLEQDEAASVSFSSQAEAIDYYLAMAERDRGEAAGVSFSSQAEAIDYYVAMAEREREAAAGVSFSSQAEAIDYYLAQLEQEEAATVSFSSQVEATSGEMDVGLDGPAVFNPLAAARQSTARYQRLEAAKEDGFVPLFECINHETDGAMGFHFINPDRFDSELTLTEPEALVYEELPNGQFKLVAVEYIIPAAAWSEAEAPTFLGQTLKYKTTVGPHEVDPYYEVHVWVWGHNPSGMFADWSPTVACAS